MISRLDMEYDSRPEIKLGLLRKPYLNVPSIFCLFIDFMG